MFIPQLNISEQQIDTFCQRWQIRELALFGSILRDDFWADSDVDVLVDFAPEARWTLFDFVHIRKKLCHLFPREVDLVSWPGLQFSRNPLAAKQSSNRLR